MLSVPLADMPDMALRLPTSLVGPDFNHLLPPFLQVNKKVTFEHEGQYVKDYLSKHDRVYRFAYKRHPNVRQENGGCPCQTFLPLGLSW